MKNGATVAAFERELASFCGAKYAIAASNGTVTLSAALAALGVTPGDRVATTPLTMSATSIAILNVGAVPVFCDVDPATWLMDAYAMAVMTSGWAIPVSLYGLSVPTAHARQVDDAAQTLRKHSGCAFTSLSFQASKILSTGEGGALLTDDEGLAERARSYLSLGYRMAADQARIDPAALKSPTFDRHHSWPAINGRMNDVTAAAGLRQMELVDLLKDRRARAAHCYREAVAGCHWLTPQHVPEGWTHDYWTYAVACDTPERALWLADAIVKQGGERPYPAWRITFSEPAFKHLAAPGSCPVAEDLQPRILQFQTNNLKSATRNATALRSAIKALTERA